ncbi:uncharacterized protein ACJ7VT_022656 [Polymixia lowei]
MEVTVDVLQSQIKEISEEVGQLQERLDETESKMAKTSANQEKQQATYQLTVKELQSASNTNGQALRAVESLVKDMGQNILLMKKVLMQAKECEHHSHTMQEKDFLISQLQEQVNHKSAQLEVMSRQLHVQSNNSCEEIEHLERRLRETEAILVQIKENEDRMRTNCRREITKLQGEAENDKNQIEMLKMRLKVMEGAGSQAKVKPRDSLLAEESIQTQAEDNNRNLHLPEKRLQDIKVILPQTSVRLFEINHLAQGNPQGQPLSIISKIHLLEMRLKNIEDILLKIADQQLYHQKCTGENMQIQDENTRKVKTLEIRLKEMQGILTQTTVKQFRDNILADEELRAQIKGGDRRLEVLEMFQEMTDSVGQRREEQTEDDEVKLEQLEQRLSDIEDTMRKTTEDDEEAGEERLGSGPLEVRHLDQNLISIRCEGFLQDRETDENLMKRLKVSDRLNEMLSSQVHLCGTIMAQRDGGLSGCFTPSALAVGKEPERPAPITQNQGVHSEVEKLMKALDESTSKVSLLQSECGLLKAEKHGLEECLAHAQNTQMSLKGSLSSAREDINRLKGEIRENQNIHSQEILNMHVTMQESKQTVETPISSGPEFGTISQDVPLSPQLFIEIKQIKEQFTHKGVPHPTMTSINSVQYGEEKNPDRNPSDTKSTDDTKGGNDDIYQSGLNTNVHESATASVDGKLSSPQLSSPYKKDANPHFAAHEENHIALRRFIAEGKTLTGRMAQLLQQALSSKHSYSPALPDDPYSENLKLNKEIETLKMEQSRNKKIISEALKQLRRVNKRKLERFCD